MVQGRWGSGGRGVATASSCTIRQITCQSSSRSTTASPPGRFMWHDALCVCVRERLCVCVSVYHCVCAGLCSRHSHFRQTCRHGYCPAMQMRVPLLPLHYYGRIAAPYSSVNEPRKDQKTRPVGTLRHAPPRYATRWRLLARRVCRKRWPRLDLARPPRPRPGNERA